MAKIFIGSSGRTVALVHEIAACLRSCNHEPLPWTETFEHGDITIDRLIALARDVDGAILIFSGDDTLDTGSRQPRPNVLIEFGLFVSHLGRKRAIVCRSGEHHFPSDLGGLTYLELEQADGRLTLNTQDKLRTWARNLVQLRRSDPAGEVGITQVYSNFPLAEFCQALKQARQIHILQTFIPYTQHFCHFESDLLEAIQRDCDVQILLMNPRSHVVELREQSLNRGYGRDSVRRQIISNLEHLASFTTRLPRDSCRRLKVRVHSTIPSMSIYRADDLFFSGHYFHGSLAIDSPQLKISSLQSNMGQCLANEHRQVWEASATTPVDLQNINDWL